MRYQMLSELLADLRAEAGLSQNVAHGVTLLEPHKALLRRVQEDLWLAYDWTPLNVSRTVDLNRGQRYYALPSGVVFEGVKRVHVRDENESLWTEIEYGITPQHLGSVDSDDGEMQSPVRRWQTYLSPDAEHMAADMFEVWPVPERSATLRFHAKRALFPLTNEDHRSTIDGPLLVLQAAAEILARNKSEEAGLKLQRAADRRRVLGLRQSASDTRRANLAGASSAPKLRPGLDYIP